MSKNNSIANLLLLVGLVVAPLFGTGCIAITVGKPESISKTTQVVETASAPSSSTVLFVEPMLEKKDGALAVSLNATIRDEYPQTKHDETVTLKKKKKLAIGLFPGAAACLLRPSNAMVPNDGQPSGIFQYFGQNLLFTVLTFGGIDVIFTLDTLFIEPFGDFSPKYSYRDPGNQYSIGHGPKARAVKSIPSDELEKMGFRTEGGRFDPLLYPYDSAYMFGLVGCFKYPVFYVDVVKSPTVPYTSGTKTRHNAIRGPYEVTLEIPDLTYRETRNVSASATETRFPIPAVPYDCHTDVQVSFREATSVFGSPDGISRQALAKACGEKYSFPVTLNATRKQPTAVRPQTTVAQPQPAVVTSASQVPAKPYDSIQKKTREDGTIEIRIRVLDTSRTFDIDRMVQPTIREIFRQEFRDNNPDCPESEIREMSKWETARDGREMVYTGGAFSLRPEMAEGTSYDAATRRGKLRLRVIGRIPPESLRDYVQRNISAIVAEKNVVLEAGKGAPPGALYQSLGETYENGILTVEFKAVE